MAKTDLIHKNSILGRAQLEGDWATSAHVRRAQRTGDIDLALKNRWARAGFVSIPGNFGPGEEDDTRDTAKEAE